MKFFVTSKTLLLALLVSCTALILTGCGKESVATKSPEEIIFEQLTGSGNKKWFLQKILVNGVEQPLTDNQKKYYKTYTRSTTALIATFLDDDGNRGRAYLISRLSLREIIENSPTGPLLRDYIILDIQDKSLSLEVTGQNQSVREVYYAN